MIYNDTCMFCIYYINNVCRNKKEATYGVHMDEDVVVSCQGRRELTREACKKYKHIRVVKSIYDYEMIKPKTVRYAN